ncbi:MAG: SH3 domain-containing protein [Burkholderiales bacterium]|nr:SH3 domain-containing protein [Burkholderiales bacterium]
MKRWKRLLPWVSAWLLAPLCLAAEMGSVVRQAELKQKPFFDAPKVTDLAASAVVEVVSRQGAWIQVKTKDGQVGWMKMLNLRTGSGDVKAGSTTSGVLAGLSLFKTGSSGTTATTGVRGLSEEDLKNAQPNPAELAKLEGYGTTADDAAKFAKAGKLVPQKDLAYLPKPSSSGDNKPDDKSH